MHVAFKKKLKKSVQPKNSPPRKEEEKKLNNLRPWFFSQKATSYANKVCRPAHMANAFSTVLVLLFFCLLFRKSEKKLKNGGKKNRKKGMQSDQLC